MKDNTKREGPEKSSRNPEDNKSSNVKKSAKEGHLFKRWRDPARKKMGNDISSEIKIANSVGKREGGDDKRWHLNEE